MRSIWILPFAVACQSESPDAIATGGATDSVTEEPEPEVCGPDAKVGLKVGRCAPDFELPLGTGESFSLHAQRGKVALVDISAVW